MPSNIQRKAEADRIRHMVALDATAVQRRLIERRDEMVEVFSRQRDRDALLLPIRSVFQTIRFGDLALLPIADQRAIHGFHEALDDLHWYLRYTVDMPGTLELRLQHFVRRLTIAFDALIVRLGRITEEQLDADMPMPTMPKRVKTKSARSRRA